MIVDYLQRRGSAFIGFVRSIPPAVYDRLILHMTEKWYRAVLEMVKEDSRILDVGIGTAGALLRCEDQLRSKRIGVVGIDYERLYVDAAQQSVAERGLESQVTVEFMSVYDVDPAHPPGGGSKLFDAAYFSGSISLLPDPPAALKAVARVVQPGGLIYITQTYQRRALPFLRYVKPMLKYLLSVDFGQLVMVDDVEKLLWRGSDLDVVEHGLIPGSVDNRFQAAYLTTLRVPLQSNDDKDSNPPQKSSSTQQTATTSSQ